MSKVQDILAALSAHDRQELVKTLQTPSKRKTKPKPKESPDYGRYKPHPFALPINEEPVYETVLPELDFANRYYCTHHSCKGNDCHFLSVAEAYKHLDASHPHRGLVFLWPDYVEVQVIKKGAKRNAENAHIFSPKVEYILELLANE